MKAVDSAGMISIEWMLTIRPWKGTLFFCLPVFNIRVRFTENIRKYWFAIYGSGILVVGDKFKPTDDCENWLFLVG